MSSPMPSPDWGRWRYDLMRAPERRVTTPAAENAQQCHEEQDSSSGRDART